MPGQKGEFIFVVPHSTSDSLEGKFRKVQCGATGAGIIYILQTHRQCDTCSLHISLAKGESFK